MSGFKVIIIGGGPIGLCAAHALSKGGIDFLLLEKRPSIVEDMGASLVLSPESMRIMGHLGLIDAIRDIGQEVLHLASFTMSGQRFMESWHPKHLKDNTGTYPYICHRADVTRVLYEGLLPKHQSQILTDKRLAEIIPTDGGVRVLCRDGSEYEGSVVIGADGVHSETRRLLHELAGEGVGLSPIEKAPFKTDYKTLFCSFPRLREFAPGDFFVTHGQGVSLQLLVSHDRSWIFVYEHMSKKDDDNTEGFPYTGKDIENFAQKHGEINIGGRLKFRDIWHTRQNCGLTRLEEGVLPRWSWGRVALAGDACHKFTPNAGMGFNCGLQDIMALVNGLYWAVQYVYEPGTLPTDYDIAETFEEYEALRMQQTKDNHATSAMVTRMCAWPNSLFWFLDQYILPAVPWVEGILFKYILSQQASQGLVLSFIKAKEPFHGKLPWMHKIREVS